MIISVLIIYLILLFSYFLQKQKNNTSLLIYNKGQLIVQLIIIFNFFIFYVFGLRILNLFREIKILDLNNIHISLNIILFLFLFLKLRSLLLFIFKVSYFKLHYVMMCETNFSEKVNSLYKKFYYNIIYFPAHYLYNYFNYLNYIFIIILIYTFFYDLYCNDLILNYCLYFFRYYSFFKLIYYSYGFMVKKQNLILDYYSFNLMYPGDSEKSFFINFKDSEHQKLKEESYKYVLGIIFEKIKYEAHFLGNVSDTPYFRSLKK